MYWVYILKCEEDFFYVGQTARLYRRFWEHGRGEGGINTTVYKPVKIMAVYKLNILGNFFYYNNYICNCVTDSKFFLYFDNLKLFNKSNKELKYNKLQIENNIAECMMIHSDNWKKIRGGRYVRFDVKYKKPINNYISNLPLCYCNLPCDIKYNSQKKYLFFRCPRKNIWESFRNTFDISEKPCKFFKEYIRDKNLRKNLLRRREIYKQKIRKIFKKSRLWLEHIPGVNKNSLNICVGGCQREKYRNISHYYEKKRLCWSCFRFNNEALEKEFNIFNNYLIDDSYE